MPRQPRDIDVSPWSELMAEAEIAFGSDLSYATAMCTRAFSIQNRKDRFAARMVLTKTVESAQARCRTDGPAVCPVTVEPCGVGSACPVADSAFRVLSGKQPPARHRNHLSSRVKPNEDGVTTTFYAEDWLLVVMELLAGTYRATPEAVGPPATTARGLSLGEGSVGDSGAQRVDVLEAAASIRWLDEWDESPASA